MRSVARISRYGRALRAAAPPLLILLLFVVTEVRAEGAPPISLGKAVETALSNHPRLSVLAAEAQAAEGRLLRSSAPLNPELEVEVANTGGSFSPTGRSETTVVYSQSLEGEKRERRVRRSEAEVSLLAVDAGIARRELVADVRRAFLLLQGAQERLALVREGEALASSLKKVASERVAAGAISPIEATRADVARSLAAADVERAAREFEEARRALAAAMGDVAPSFTATIGDIPEDLSVPEAEGIEKAVAAGPDLARWDAERNRRRADLEHEKSLASPDVTLRGGVKYLRDESAVTFIVGASVPLAFRSRNEGGIREAQARLAGVDAEKRDAENRLRTHLAQRREDLAAAAREARSLREGAMAGAKSAYDAVNEGYRLGKFRYLDVLDAGKVFLETRLRYLETLVNLNLARVDVERLSASSSGEAADAAPADRSAK